ncbi:MAG: hypothetical protein HY370_01320 [Proteobacteria bacterium]|nr:hypothetical protein [Pseudomonadota bacterium]
MKCTARNRLVYLFFAASLAANIFFWIHSHGLRSEWANVPPAPARAGAAMMGIGDEQFAYRAIGIMLQNMGDYGGRVTPLSEYDFGALKNWFFLEDSLDSHSNYIPFLAAYYYAGTQDPDNLTPVIDYLEEIGARSEGQKWRYLAQAVFLARFVQGDLNRALVLAEKLSALWEEGRPAWMRQMPSFIMAAQGDQRTAYEMMMSILQNDAEKMDPAEVRFMAGYICERLLTPESAREHPLCKAINGL